MPFSASVPLASSATRGRRGPHHGLHERRAHVRELDEVLGRGRRRSRRSRAAGTACRARGRARRARAGGRRASASTWNRPAASAAPVEPPETSASARPSATACTACTIEASGVARTARAGSPAFAIETGASTTSSPGAGSISAAGPKTSTRTPLREAASAPPRATSRGAGVGAGGVERDRQRMLGRGHGRSVIRAGGHDRSGRLLAAADKDADPQESSPDSKGRARSQAAISDRQDGRDLPHGSHPSGRDRGRGRARARPHDRRRSRRWGTPGAGGAASGTAGTC